MNIAAQDATSGEAVGIHSETNPVITSESPKLEALPESPVLSEPDKPFESPLSLNSSVSSSTNEPVAAPIADALEASTPTIADPAAPERDLIESLIEKSGVRFGDEFEARVRELVAQRVAEIVAERMLAAFGAGAVIAPPAQSNGRVQSRGGRTSAKNSAQDSDSMQVAPAKRKGRTPTKQTKSPSADVREPKRR